MVTISPQADVGVGSASGSAEQDATTKITNQINREVYFKITENFLTVKTSYNRNI